MIKLPSTTRIESVAITPLFSRMVRDRPDMVAGLVTGHGETLWCARKPGLQRLFDYNNELISCALPFAAGDFGWKRNTSDVPTEAKRFINALKLGHSEPAEINWNDICDNKFWFDASSKENQAFYEIYVSTVSDRRACRASSEYTITFGVFVHFKKADAAVLKNIRRIDRALHFTACLFRVPEMPSQSMTR